MDARGSSASAAAAGTHALFGRVRQDPLLRECLKEVEKVMHTVSAQMDKFDVVRQAIRSGEVDTAWKCPDCKFENRSYPCICEGCDRLNPNYNALKGKLQDVLQRHSQGAFAVPQRPEQKKDAPRSRPELLPFIGAAMIADVERGDVPICPCSSPPNQAKK